ncbi:MAG: Ig-like domain-containing protein, partial [Acidimicrobiia bacterium]
MTPHPRSPARGLLAGGLAALILAASGLSTAAHAAPPSPPETEADFASVATGGTVEIDVLDNDEGDDLELSVDPTVEVPGTAVVDDDEIVYTAPADFYGSVSFPYAATDDDGQSTAGTVNVFVFAVDNPGNDAPLARDDQAVVVAGDSVTINVLLNDLDPDGEALKITGVDNPAPILGTALDNAVTITYTADATAAGQTDSFEYTVGDFTAGGPSGVAVGGSATATVQVDIIADTSGGANQDPVAAPDQIAALEDEPIQIDVLANDADPDGDTLTLDSAGVIDGGPGDTAATGNLLVFTPADDFSGSVFLEYVVSDGNGGFAVGFVEVLVQPVGEPDDDDDGDGDYDDDDGDDDDDPPFGPGGVNPLRVGYRLVATDGGVFTYGGASYHGSTGGIVLNKPIVGIAGTPTDNGYWLVASDGGVFTFGDAKFFGSTGNMVLNKPVKGMAAAPQGTGYWLVASDGGIFTFGTAPFFGSTGNIVLNAPVVGMTATPGAGGYRLVATDGGVFNFGDAGYHGSTGALRLNRPIVGMQATDSGRGYWFVGDDGGIFSFG